MTRRFDISRQRRKPQQSSQLMEKSKRPNLFGIPSFAYASRDIPAGLVVFLVALPLCLGIALASGAPPLSGIISGIIGGLVVGWLSGSEKSVSGPAAGLAVIVLGAIQKLGSYETFTLAVLLAGVIQLVFGYIRAGGIGDFIPHSVIKGMLAAIGLVLVLKQLPHAMGDDQDFVGDQSFQQPDQLNTFTEIGAAISSISPGALSISLASLLILVGWESKWIRRFKWSSLVPPALLVVILGTVMNEVFVAWIPGWALTSEREQLVQLPVISSVEGFFGLFSLPRFSDITQGAVWVTAATLAIVGSVETLLCLEATDKLDPEKRLSDPNRELRAQGVGNLLSGLVGGLPITSVIVRSSANIYAGARTRLSAILHGAMLLLALLFLSRFLNRIPLAALAAILIAVGYKLASVKVMAQMWRQGLTQFLPFAATVVAIMVTDLLKGICFGFLVGIFFVMRTNHHSAVTLVNEGQNWMLRFNKDMSFVNKQELKKHLRKMPNGSRLIVNGSKAVFVDHDVYEALEEFGTSARYRGIEIEYHNVLGKERFSR
jgi:MFS superfamily sulfate permease-like transporter